jgi:4-amino-4-deoxy-L-arabinose transferase-like glycosyltransferase
VDFESRQPLYAFTNAAMLKLFGINYISGRILPMACSFLTGLMVFLLGLILFDKKVAVLSGAIYWMLPLEVINSVIVKTEPLVMLLTCMSLFAVMLFSRNNRTVWLILAGIFAAMGFYVRQSALIIPLTVFGFLLICHGGRFREIVKCLGLFIIGYICIVLLAMVYYTKYLSFQEFFWGDLSPSGFIIQALKKLVSLMGFYTQSSNDVNGQAQGLPNGSYGLYVNYIRQAVHLHSFLLLGFVFSFITRCRRLLSGNNVWGEKHFTSHSFLYLWVFSLFMAYTYFFYVSGFYIDYFREFLPPLVIIFSAWLCYSVPAFEANGIPRRLILGVICLCAIFVFSVIPYGKGLGMRFYLPLSIAFFTLFYFIGGIKSSQRRFVFMSTITIGIIIVAVTAFIPMKSFFLDRVTKFTVLCIIIFVPFFFLRKGGRSVIKEYARFMSFTIVLGAFVLSLAYSTNRLTLAYDSNWSPESLEKVSKYVKKNTRSTDTIMSGAVIWELQAQRKPFLDISHPLKFEEWITERERERLETGIRTYPPEIIILDGYTEKTYFRQVPWLWNFLSFRYDLVHTAEPARHPVKVYRQKESF